MGGFFMLRKWKKYGCILFLLIALPYVITIFINGPSGLTAPKQKETEVSVQSGGNDRMTTMSLDDMEWASWQKRFQWIWI